MSPSTTAESYWYRLKGQPRANDNEEVAREEDDKPNEESKEASPQRSGGDGGEQEGHEEKEQQSDSEKQSETPQPYVNTYPQWFSRRHSLYSPVSGSSILVSSMSGVKL